MMNTENFTLICRIAELLDQLDDQLDRTGDVGRMVSAQHLESEELMSRGETGHDVTRHGTLGRTLTMSRLNQGAQSRVTIGTKSGVLDGRGFADKVTTTSVDLELERRHSVGSDILRKNSNLGELELAGSLSSAMSSAPIAAPYGRAAGEFVRHESESREWSEMEPCEEEEMVDLEMGFGRDHKIRWAKGFSPSYSVLSSDLEYSETSSAHESEASELNFEAETVASKLASDPELLRNLLTKVVELLDYEFPAKLNSLARNYKETEQNYTRLNDRYEALTCETDEQHQEIVKLQASVDSLASQLRDSLQQNVQLKAAAAQVKTYKDQIQEIESEKQVEIDRVRKETRKQTVRLIKSGFGVGDIESRRGSRKGTMESPSFSKSPSRSMKFPSASPRKLKSVNVVEPGAALARVVQNHDVAILQNRISALEDEKNTQAQLLQTSIEILKSENSSLKTAVESLETELNKVESLKAEKTQVDAELTQKTLAIEQLIQELSEFEDQMDEAEKEKKVLLGELQKSEQIRLACSEAYEGLKASLNAQDASKRLTDLSGEIELRKANVDRLRSAITRCDELIATKTKYIEFIKDQVTSQAADLTKLHEVSAGLMLDTEVIKMQVNKLNDLIGELNRKVELVREDIGSLGAENQSELRRENKRLEDVNNTLSGINVSLGQKNTEIKESLDKEIARLTVEVENRQVYILTLEESVRMKDQMLAAAMKRYEAQSIDFEGFKVDTDLNNRRLNDQMRVVEFISEERDNFRNALETITGQSAVGKDQIKQALTNKGISDAKFRELQQQITLVENGKHQLLEELKEANAQVSDLVDANLKLRQRNDGLSNELKQLIHAAEANRRDLETMNGRLQSLSDQNKQVSDSLNAAKNSGFDKDVLIGEAQSRISIQAKIEANYKRNYSALLRELDIYRAKIGNLETKFQTAETTNIELKSQVDLLTSEKLENLKALALLGLENKVLDKKLSTLEKFENSTQTSDDKVAHEAASSPSAEEIARLKILVNNLQHQRPAEIQIAELRARIKYLTNSITELQQLNRKSHKSLPCDILQNCCSRRETEPKSAFVSLPSSPARYHESPSISDLATVINPLFEPKLRPVANFGRSPPSVEKVRTQNDSHEMMPNPLHAHVHSVEPLSRMSQKPTEPEYFSIKTSVLEDKWQTRAEIYKSHPRSTQNSRTAASYSLPSEPRTFQPVTTGPNNGKTAKLAFPPGATYELSRPIVSSQQTPSPNTDVLNAMPDRREEIISKPTLPNASRPSVPESTQITAEHTIGDGKFEQAPSAAPGGVSKGPIFPARRLPHSRIPSRVLYVEPLPQPEVVPKRPLYVKPEQIYNLEKVDLSYEHPSPKKEWVKKEESKICCAQVAPEPRRDKAETPTSLSDDKGSSPNDKGTVKKTVSRLEQAAEAYQERVRKQRLALAGTKMSPVAQEHRPRSFERVAEFEAIKRQRQLGYQPCTSERLPAHFPRVLHDPATGRFRSPTELSCRKGVNGPKVSPNVKHGQVYLPPNQVSRPVDQQSGRTAARGCQLPLQCGGEPVIRDFIDSQGFIHRGYYDNKKQIIIQHLDPRCRALSSPCSGDEAVPIGPVHVDSRNPSHVDPKQYRDPRQNPVPRTPNHTQYSYPKITQIASSNYSMAYRNGFTYPYEPTRYPEQQQIVENRGCFQQMMERPGSKFVDEQTMTNGANQLTESQIRQATIVPPLRLDKVKRPNLDEEPPMFFPPGGLLGQLGSLVRSWMG